MRSPDYLNMDPIELCEEIRTLELERTELLARLQTLMDNVVSVMRDLDMEIHALKESSEP
jgi:hypothetical protein